MKLPNPIKTDNPIPWGILPSEMAHTVYGVCISLNKPFTLLWLALEFFPAWSQELTLGGSPRDSPETWNVTILSGPTFFPAAHWLHPLLPSLSVSVSFPSLVPKPSSHFCCLPIGSFLPKLARVDFYYWQELRSLQKLSYSPHPPYHPHVFCFLNPTVTS